MDEYDVMLDGRVVGRSVGGEFHLSGLKSGTDYIVELLGAVETDAGAVTAQRTVSMTTHATDSELQSSQAGIMTYQAYNTAFTHRTFIPEAQVGAWMCDWTDTSYTFDGDNRSWSFPNASEPWQTPNYRTSMFANINWETLHRTTCSLSPT